MLVKELQSLALDLRVYDRNGQEIKLNSLCNDDTPSYSNKADISLLDGQLDETVFEEDDIKDSFIFDDEEELEDEEVLFESDDEDEKYSLDDDNM